MRIRTSAWLLACMVLAGPVVADAQAVAVGSITVMVPDGSFPAVETSLWYPAVAGRPGVPSGRGLPLVVFSHGAGGNRFGHTDTAQALAQAGFIVAAPTHAMDRAPGGEVVAARVRQVSEAIDYVLNTWSPGAADPRRIGAFGYSLGGLTVLIEAGATLERPWGPPAATPPHDPRIRALVLAAPSIAFGERGLRGVSVPVQLWRADDDTVLPPAEFADVLRGALPRPPEFHAVPHAGHFDFLAPCQDTGPTAPEWCHGEPGFDRAAFHRHFNADIVHFFQQTLR